MLRRGCALAGLTLGLVAASPSPAEANAPVCTKVYTGDIWVGVGNYYSLDEMRWVGGLEPWEIANADYSNSDVLTTFVFGAPGLLTIVETGAPVVTYTVEANDELNLTFEVDEEYYLLWENSGPAVTSPSFPGDIPPEPQGAPLPTNEVVLHPKPSCPQ